MTTGVGIPTNLTVMLRSTHSSLTGLFLEAELSPVYTGEGHWYESKLNAELKKNLGDIFGYGTGLSLRYSANTEPSFSLSDLYTPTHQIGLGLRIEPY